MDGGIRAAGLNWLSHLEALLQHSHDVLMVLSAGGEVLYRSPSMARLLNSQWCGPDDSHWTDWIVPADRAGFEEAFQQVLKVPGSHPEAEYRLRISGEDSRWVSTVFSNQIENPLVAGIICNTHDIHGSRLLELEVRRSESRLRAIVEAIPDVQLIARIESGTVTFSSVHPSERDDQIGLNLKKSLFAFPEDIHRSRFQQAVLEACHSGELQVYTYELKTHAGRRAIEARFSQSGPQECLVLLRDVTERDRAIEHQKQAYKFDALGLITRGLCDRLDDIVLRIVSRLEPAEAPGPAETASSSQLEAIQANLEEIEDISSQLKDFTGRPASPPEVIEVNEFFTTLLDQYRNIKPANIGIHYAPIAMPTTLAIDARRFTRIINNLLINSAEAIQEKEDGRISISVRTEYLLAPADLDNLLGFEMDSPGIYLLIDVTDNGCGIDENHLPHILDPFYTTKQNGRGLGLSAAVGFAKDYHGGVRIVSSPEQGTSIALYLPYSRQESSGSLDLTAGRGRRKILLAEDDELLRSFMAEYMASMGFEIIEATDGREAIDSILLHEKDLTMIILDLIMPRLSGLEVLRLTRQRGIKLPIVIATGYLENFRMTFDDAQQISCILRKPFSSQELAEVVYTIAT